MNQRLPFIFTCLLLLFLTTALSSCAPAPGSAPSPALNEQLQQLKTQQQQQNEQLRILQQQLSHIEKVLGIESADAQPSIPVVFPEQREQQPSYTESPQQQTPEAKAYFTAFDHLAGARYAAAEASFENFLDQYPDHQQAPDARFRLAGAQISQGKYDLAASHLRRIITDPGAQPRTPAAMLQLAQIYRQQERNTESDAILHQLRERYPASPEAQNIIQNSSN